MDDLGEKPTILGNTQILTNNTNHMWSNIVPLPWFFVKKIPPSFHVSVVGALDLVVAIGSQPFFRDRNSHAWDPRFFCLTACQAHAP